MPLPSFLNQKETVKLPVGGDFGPNSFIGPFAARVLYSFYSAVDLMQEWKALDQKPTMVSRRKMGPGWRYYYDDSALASKALELAGNDQIKNASQVWTFQAETAKLLNLAEENKEKFGDAVTYDVDILTLRSKKRHPFQLMALPSAVASMAKLLGYDTPGFPLNELTSQDAIFTDEFRTQMIGDPETGDYENSVLWQRRLMLWTALGEKDAKRYNPKGTGTKFDTESDKLSECLSIIALAWSGPAYLRLVQVPDPRVDATYGDDHKRLTVPCIYTVYPDAKTAKGEADEELARRKAGGDAHAGTNGNGPIATGLQVPAAWKDLSREDFIAEVKNTAKKPIAAAAKELEITKDELTAWRAEVGIGA